MPDPSNSDDRSSLINGSSSTVSPPLDPTIVDGARAYSTNMLQTSVESLVTISWPLTVSTAPQLLPTSRYIIDVDTSNSQVTDFTIQLRNGNKFQIQSLPFQINCQNLTPYKSMAISTPPCPPERPRAPTAFHKRNTSRPFEAHYRIFDSQFYKWCLVHLQYEYRQTLPSVDDLFTPCGPYYPPAPCHLPAKVSQAHANFESLPPELRIMIWKFSCMGPRLVRWGKYRPPAVSQVNCEARRVFLKCHPAERHQIELLERKGMYINYSTDLLYFEEDDGIPGISEWSRIPFRVALPDMPICPLSGTLLHGLDNGLEGTDPWPKKVIQLALSVHLAFKLFRLGAYKRADARWKKLNSMCPKLKELILVVGTQQPRLDHTFENLEYVEDNTVDAFRDRGWVRAIRVGYDRNVSSGNITRNYALLLMRLKLSQP